MAAITGLDKDSKPLNASFSCTSFFSTTRALTAANSLTSDPAQNALSPAPVTTTARTVSSRSSSWRASVSCLVISSVTRLSGGLLRVSFATPPARRSTRTSRPSAGLDKVKQPGQAQREGGEEDEQRNDHEEHHVDRQRRDQSLREGYLREGGCQEQSQTVGRCDQAERQGDNGYDTHVNRIYTPQFDQPRDNRQRYHDRGYGVKKVTSDNERDDDEEHDQGRIRARDGFDQTGDRIRGSNVGDHIGEGGRAGYRHHGKRVEHRRVHEVLGKFAQVSPHEQRDDDDDRVDDRHHACLRRGEEPAQDAGDDDKRYHQRHHARSGGARNFPKR